MTDKNTTKATTQTAQQKKELAALLAELEKGDVQANVLNPIVETQRALECLGIKSAICQYHDDNEGESKLVFSIIIQHDSLPALTDMIVRTLKNI